VAQIGDIFVTRKLKELFSLTGRFSPRLDDVVVPTVVIEQFRASDATRGPVEAVASGQVPAVAGETSWAGLTPPSQTTTPHLVGGTPRPPKLVRVLRVFISSANTANFEIKVTPTAVPASGVDPFPVYEDRRYANLTPLATVREKNAINPAPPAGGIQIWNGRITGGRWVDQVFERLILVPGHNLVVQAEIANQELQYMVEWQELDADQTSTIFR
jgi:hypothetical protein